MNAGLAGKVAIVTGASSGIGAATARRLCADGAAVVLAARREDRLDALQGELEGQGGRALAIPTDVTDRSAVDVMARTTLQWFERIDVLVNNAGVMLLSPLVKLNADEWDRMVDINVKGPLHCIAAVLPTMVEQGGGHIVNVGSVAGRRPLPGGTVYSCTKSAVRALSEGLRSELSPHHGIRVTDIEPGVVDTELADHITDAQTRSDFRKRWGDRRRLGAEDVASVIHFVVTRPIHVNVNELLVRPTEQET